MIQFDLRIFVKWVGKNHQLVKVVGVRNAILDLTFSKVFKVRKSKYLESSHA